MAAVIAPRSAIDVAAADPEGKPFLVAEWRDFLMISYEIEPAALSPYIPAGTELDFWRGRTFVSVVGFMFLNARLFGLKIPGYAAFEEVNLRFYVRRKADRGWRRGVVFVRELAARRAVALAARWLYGERFARVPMHHRFDREAPEAAPRRVEYSWKHRGRLNSLAAGMSEAPRQAHAGSLEEFVVDHYWAYTAARSQRTTEYLVPHAPWRIARADDVHFDCDAWEQYGPRFAPFLQGKPASAFWAEGSLVRVYPGRRI